MDPRCPDCCGWHTHTPECPRYEAYWEERRRQHESLHRDPEYRAFLEGVHQEDRAKALLKHLDG